ncbi:TrbI F-type domain-containing protein [Erythrobacter sp. SCSIO 43205]|uniref:TrbI F-type domain-containing protein n=1 Tax=Erythrobacter sp. SCSIO 43205 TaxID=2779361 RepID=UPI001CAA09AE|nr:TrbI F-type domain-containing protein [Erythrobacter sp. SCSIO 43205]UAB78948.1 TrbI F-type domain-containing protein [Erythrobacter sp. SCSIO 43205]
MVEANPTRALLFKALVVTVLIGALLWGAWITREVAQAPPSQRIVTVRLAETIGSFVEEAAHADAEPAAVQAASLAYLKAAESAVEDMGRDGRVILVAEAVLAGAAEDATPELEARIAEKLQTGEQP